VAIHTGINKINHTKGSNNMYPQQNGRKIPRPIRSKQKGKYLINQRSNTLTQTVSIA
jgi:hypothetical protein